MTMDRINQNSFAHQNDYLWPDILRPQSSTAITKLCLYNRLRNDELLDETLDKSFEWSQMIPMVQRLKSKIEIRCPHLYKIEKVRPERKYLDKTSERIKADRWKTTYQVDFSDPAAVRMARSMAEYNKLSKVDDMTYHQKLKRCMPIKIIVKSDCLPKCYLSSEYYGNRKHGYKKNEKKKTKCEDERNQIQMPTWKSEYQDSISKIGQSIIKAKLHTKKRATPLLTISY